MVGRTMWIMTNEGGCGRFTHAKTSPLILMQLKLQIYIQSLSGSSTHYENTPV